MFPLGTLSLFTHTVTREEEAGVKVYHSRWHLAVVTRRDHACHLPLAGANPAIRIIDKNNKEKNPVEMFEGGFATVSNRLHVLEHRFFFSQLHHLLLTFLWSAVCWQSRRSERSDSRRTDTLEETDTSHYCQFYFSGCIR